MGFVIDPPIATKILKMKERVRWGDRGLIDHNIDQTQLVIDDQQPDSQTFSFLVLGDSGTGYHRGHNPQRKIAQQMLAHQDSCRFTLHTGDVIYLVGSSEYYPRNFIEPYQEWLVGGDQPDQILYDQMLFKTAFLPVPGNHDYYDLPKFYGLLAQATLPLRYLLRHQLDLNVGWHGSYQGQAYAKAFMDCLNRFTTQEALSHHLQQHYTAKTQHGLCLRYQPGCFTRVPNHYYTFRVGGIDFFALDSNTWNAPIPLSQDQSGNASRVKLKQQRAAIAQEHRNLLTQVMLLNLEQTEDPDQLDDVQAKLEQLAEMMRDIDKQLAANESTMTDMEQLEWLQQRLIESWQCDEVRGRVLYFHHPPYVTEATKWKQAQTLAVRDRLRQVLNAVAEKIGPLAENRPIVDLVINGHAHCFEHLQTTHTGHADSHTNWIVCGGSGFSLRRQRPEGEELTELQDNTETVIARSHLFVGRNGQGKHKRRPYSFVRVDVKEGCPPQFVVRPFVAEWSHRKWHEYAIEPFEI